MISLTGKLSHFNNSDADNFNPYSQTQKDVFDMANTKQAMLDISSFPGYKPTPFYNLKSMACDIGVKNIWYKDESVRFDLKSFKALGGAYAVARQLQKYIYTHSNVMPSFPDLLNNKFKKIASKVVVSCATDGNHGKSVAWGAQLFGCGCVIYIHKNVSVGRQQAMEKFGAQVIRIKGNYDESVRLADQHAKAYNRIIVSDTSYEGYTEIPKDISIGYGIMLDEICEALDGEIPTHVFIQAGCGGLAAVVCGYFWQKWQAQKPRFITIEPEKANCLQESARAKKLTIITGELTTIMAGLSCGEVSLTAWEILANGVNDFLTISENAIGQMMRILAKGYKNDPSIEAGESAVPGLAALIIAQQNNNIDLGLSSDSKILVIGTEGATDIELYNKIIANCN